MYSSGTVRFPPGANNSQKRASFQYSASRTTFVPEGQSFNHNHGIHSVVDAVVGFVNNQAISGLLHHRVAPFFGSQAAFAGDIVCDSRIGAVVAPIGARRDHIPGVVAEQIAHVHMHGAAWLER